MQKVVGSNPISRSEVLKMASANRKGSRRKQGRSTRRGGILRRGKEENTTENTEAKSEGQGSAEKAKPEKAKAAESKIAESKDAPKQPESEKVSSLLETTSQEVKQLLEAADDAAQKIREAARSDVKSGDKPSGDKDEVSSLIERTNEEVQQVLESADEAAEKIRDEARAEAHQFIEEARRRAEDVTNEQMDRVSRVTERLLEDLSAVEQQLAALRTSFDHAMEAMGGDLAIEETAVWESQNGAPEQEEESELRRRLGRRHQRKTAAPREPDGISEGARLLALQQLMAGVDADVIESRLKKEFGIENPKPILEWMGLQAEQKPEQKTEKKS
jgi:hypothetical protein